jgi:hypothetical protein
MLALLVLAAAFWGQAPPCQPTLTRAELPPPTVGLANLADCSITVDPPPFAGAECMVVLHEYGHLLGPRSLRRPERRDVPGHPRADLAVQVVTQRLRRGCGKTHRRHPA